MYNNDVGQESAQKIMKQTGDLKACSYVFRYSSHMSKLHA